MYENPWLWNDRPFDDHLIGDSVGFVYIITNTENGFRYIGKKIFWLKVVKKPLKGKKNRRISRKSSDWKDYYGSNETLKNLVATDQKSKYRREILHLCTTKSQMSYLETKEILTRDVLLHQGWYNDWVSAKITRKQLRAGI